jgi:Ser/Thr protein kinase RdoA (MazF antagonist)
MRAEEVRALGAALGSAVMGTRTLAGGFSHETCLLTLTVGQVVARLGGSDPAVEAAVMARAGERVPVPRVLSVLPAVEGGRPAMVLEYVPGTPLSEVLAGDEPGMGELGAEVGRVVADIGAVAFDRPGFFAGEELAVRAEEPWSRQLPEVARACMAATSDGRLDPVTKTGWVGLCESHASALTRIDHHARLVHADINPKNILVSRTTGEWRVDAVLDWEFSYSGCPYGDAANMARFGDSYPADFLNGFLTAFAENQPPDLPLPDDWEHLGRVLDMFALSDLVTHPPGHPVADLAAERIRHWVAEAGR